MTACNPQGCCLTPLTNHTCAQGVYELLGSGSSWQALRADLQAEVAAAPQRFGQWAGASFKVVVDTWGHAISMGEQVQLIEALDFLPFKVRLPGRSCCPRHPLQS